MSKPRSRQRMERKRRVFRPITKPRYLIGAVGTSIWEEDLRMYNRHRFNCLFAEPIVDTSPPSMNPHNYVKTRRLADDADRLTRIDKENKELLKKINLINRSKGWVESFNPTAYEYITNWQRRKTDALYIQKCNLHLYNRLVKTKSVYETKKFEKDWKAKVKAMAHMAKFTLQMFLQKTIDKQVEDMPSISGDLEKRAKRPTCFMDFRVKDGVSLGRIIIELYMDYVPVTCRNFLELCKGTREYSYKNCRINNIVKGQYLESGDVTTNNGKGGASIYGDFFPEENNYLKHTKPGVLSMLRFGKGQNNSQFSITFAAQEHLDGKRVVFGKVIKGIKTLFQIQDLGKKIGSPIVPIYIENCGELRRKKKRQTCCEKKIICKK